MLPLHAERLVLRDFVPDDLQAFAATARDPDYRRFYARHETAPAFLETLFQRFLASAQAPRRTAYQLAVCLKAGELIGTCGLRIESPEDRRASFGCALDRAHWGRGLAGEAARRLLDFGFSSLPIHRVYAETISENAPARALCERLGMRLEGEFRQHRHFRGRWWNTAVYALLRDEWPASGLRR